LSLLDIVCDIVYDSNTMAVPQVVLDTNVLVSGLRSRRGASYRLLTLVGTGVFEIHLSVPLVLEYEAVLKRMASDLGFTLQDIDDFLDYLIQVAHRHTIYFLWRPYLQDPKDHIVLEVAIAGRCHAIVTHNVRNFHLAANLGIQVLRPREFLRLLF